MAKQTLRDRRRTTKEVWVGREKQLFELKNTLHNDINFPLILVHGPPSSGKTSLVQHVIQLKGINHVYVPCRLVFTPRQLFDVILNAIKERFGAMSNQNTPIEFKTGGKRSRKKVLRREYANWRRHSAFADCADAKTFAHIITDENPTQQSSFYIILDHFELLQRFDRKLLPSLVQCMNVERMYRNVCRIGFIFIGDTSSILNLKDYLGLECTSVRKIHFPQYSDTQLQSILISRTRAMCRWLKTSSARQARVVEQIIQIFSIYTRRIDQFDQIFAQILPVIASQSDGSLIHETMGVLLKEISHSHVGINYSKEHYLDDMRRKHEKYPNGVKPESPPDLPYASKLMLIAAYLGSYNSVQFNEFQFCEAQRRKRKRRKGVSANSAVEVSLMDKGPQTFSFDLLKGIFLGLSKLTKANGQISVKPHDLRSQMAHLVSLSLICKVNKSSDLDALKLKCCVTHDYAHFLARIMGVKLSDFLEHHQKLM